MSREGDGEFIYYLKAKEVHISSSEPVAWTVDGEEGGSHEEVDIVVHKQMLDIFVEKKYLEMIGKNQE